MKIRQYRNEILNAETFELAHAVLDLYRMDKSMAGRSLGISRRRYRKEILKAQNTHMAQMLINMYRKDDFDMNHRFGVLGRTMVESATRAKNEDLVKLLMRNGASIYATSRFGKKNALQLFIQKFGEDSQESTRMKATHQFIMDLGDI